MPDAQGVQLVAPTREKKFGAQVEHTLKELAYWPAGQMHASAVQALAPAAEQSPGGHVVQPAPGTTLYVPGAQSAQPPPPTKYVPGALQVHALEPGADVPLKAHAAQEPPGVL